MNLQHLAKIAAKRTVDHSPTILTGIACAGTAMTAYLTFKATWRAADEIIFYENVNQNPTLTKKERFLMVWKLYIPAVGTGLMTVTCIVMANRISSRRAAALAAAYVTSQEFFDEYREKIVEKFGEKKEQEAHDEVVTARVQRAEAPVLLVGDGKSIFCDLSTMRFFESTRQTIEKAQNDLNYRLNNEGFADLNEFYSLAGIDHTNVGDQLGWNSDNLLELKWTAVLMPDGQAASAFTFVPEPKANFDSWR